MLSAWLRAAMMHPETTRLHRCEELYGARFLDTERNAEQEG